LYDFLFVLKFSRWKNNLPNWLPGDISVGATAAREWGERLSPHYRAYHAPFGLQAMQVPHLASRPFDMSSLQREMRGMDSEGGWWPGNVNVETVSTQEMCSTWPNVREAMATRLISPCHVASSSGGDGRAKLTFGPLDGGVEPH